ncbi:MAG: zf-HC2 domain-containing protein [Armatimonadetes bacterium]|nr:zf-HC2 domain-containing protein [Armatimonadota bacterium]
MNCRNASQSISAYLDGELTGTTMLELSRHLQECATCQSELESMRHIKSMLGKMSVVAPSAD